jgi:hypothetical protein
MKKLRIGYWPLTANLNSAGDRRRLVFWAEARGHTIVTDLSQAVDVIVASEKSDFNSHYFSQEKIPVIFDLVDAYLSPLNSIDDFARGLAKKLSGQISGYAKPFSQHVRDFCLNSNAVLCSSVEQAELIKPYNSNIHVILDSHHELPFIEGGFNVSNLSNKNQILWEGQPATIRGVRQISSILLQLTKENISALNFVTDEKYFQFLNKYIEKDTSELLKKDLSPISSFINVVPWTRDNLVSTARRCGVSMIPIDLSVPMHRLKPENKLLIMWRLGLPCLVSPSPAYIRVASEAGVNAVCEDPDTWLGNFRQLLNCPSYAREEVLRGQSYLLENHTRSLLLDKWDVAIESVMG